MFRAESERDFAHVRLKRLNIYWDFEFDSIRPGGVILYNSAFVRTKGYRSARSGHQLAQFNYCEILLQDQPPLSGSWWLLEGWQLRPWRTAILTSTPDWTHRSK